MDSYTNNKEGNGNLQSDEEEARTSGATRSSPPPATQTTAALDLKSVSSPLIPPAQIHAAHAAKMEMEYDARYGATKNVMKGGPELIQDEEVPMPAQAQINQAQEEIESKARAARHVATKNVESFRQQLQSLQDMGFTDRSANIRALSASQANVDRAIEILLENPPEMGGSEGNAAGDDTAGAESRGDAASAGNMPAQAQISQAQEDIGSKARAARHGATKNVMKGGPELIQEEEVPMPPHAGNDYDEELDSLEQGSGELGNTNTGMADRHTISTNTPHSPPTMTPSIMQPRSNSNPELMQALSQLPEELGNTGMTDEQTIITNTPHPPPSMTTSIMQPQPTSTPELMQAPLPLREEPDLPLLEATLVVNEPDNPVYDAVHVAETDDNDNKSSRPWWEEHRHWLITILVAAVVGLAVATGLGVKSGSNGDSSASVPAKSDTPANTGSDQSLPPVEPQSLPDTKLPTETLSVVSLNCVNRNGKLWLLCPGMDDADYCDGNIHCSISNCDCDAGQRFCTTAYNPCYSNKNPGSITDNYDPGSDEPPVPVTPDNSDAGSDEPPVPVTSNNSDAGSDEPPVPVTSDNPIPCPLRLI